MRLSAVLGIGLLLCGCEKLGISSGNQQQATTVAPVGNTAAAGSGKAKTVEELLREGAAWGELRNQIADDRRRDTERWNESDEQYIKDRNLDRRRDDERIWEARQKAYNDELARHQAALDQAAAQRRAEELARQQAADERARANRR